MNDLALLFEHIKTNGQEDATGWTLPVVYPLSRMKASLCATRANKVQVIEAASRQPITLDNSGAHFWVKRLQAKAGAS